MTAYLTFVEIVAIHEDLIERFGGSQGIRDAGALESALFRPQSGYYQDIFQEAAAMWESLAQNHPFVDGNKRVAFAATYTFLSINGFSIKAEAIDIFEFIDSLYQSNSFRFEHLEPWLRANVESEPS